MLLVRNFESTKTPREALLDAYDCCLAHPTPLHPPIRSVPEFSGAVVACQELSLSANEVQTVSWGLFFCLILCTPNVDQFRPLQHLKVEV